MISFLKEQGITEEVIKDIENTYDENILYAMNTNEYEIIKILNFLKKIGIDVIDELLVYNINLFLYSFDEIAEKLSRYNQQELAKKINEDYMFINSLMKY